MRKLHLAAAVASALALSTPASAGFFDFTLAPYIGANIGQSEFDRTCDAASCDENDLGWKLFGGMEMNEYISMEVGYVDLGKIKTSVKNSTAQATDEVTGFTVQMLGTYALNPSFTLFGMAGFGIMHTDIKSTAVVPNANANDTDFEWTLGLGGQYNFTKSLGVRAEWERYFSVGDPDNTGEANIDMLSVGLVVKF